MLLREYLFGIFEYRRITAFLVAVSVLLCTMKLKSSESYTAQIVIKYTDPRAEEGFTENGSQINPYEINSPLVVKNALSVLGFKNVNTEAVCSGLAITPIVPTAEDEKYASWIAQFSDYENTEEQKRHTVYYSVKFTTPLGKDYAKRVLNAVISQYRLYYVENYTFNKDITNLSGDAALEYDYYDTVDMLRKKINNNIEYLTQIASDDVDYRSPQTGYSLTDLAAEYKSLAEQDLSVAERMVVENGLTKNALSLKNTLQNKMTEASYDINLNTRMSETQKTLMDVYSEKNKQYLWDEQNGIDGSGSVGSQVRENTERNTAYVQGTSVYDRLVLDYVRYRTNAMNAEIDRQHYETDAAAFSDMSGNTVLRGDLEKRLQSTCDSFNALYALTKKTLTDYNSYKAAQSITCISGVVAHKTANTIFLYAVSFVLAVMMGLFISGVLVYIKSREKQPKSAEDSENPEESHSPESEQTA